MKKYLKAMLMLIVLMLLAIPAVLSDGKTALAKVVDGIDTEKIYTMEIDLVSDGNDYMLCMTGDGTGKNDKVRLRPLKQISTHANLYFQFERTSDGYWAIKAAGSKKYIDIEGKSKVKNKCLHNYHESIKQDNQKFELEKAGYGYYIKIPGTDLVWSLEDKIWDDGVYECDVRTGTKKYRINIEPVNKMNHLQYYDYNVEPWKYHASQGVYGLTVKAGDNLEKYGEEGKYELPATGKVRLDKKALLSNKYKPWTTLFELPVKDVDLTLKDGQSMKRLTIPKGVERITKIGGGDGITEVVVPNTVTEISKGAFADNASLNGISLPDNVTKLDGTFKNCTNLQSASLPKKLTEFGENTFKGCKLLKNINIPENQMLIGNYCFSGCTGLEAIVIKDKQPFTIGTGAFENCSSLKKFWPLLTSSGKITNGICTKAFSGCENITSIRLTTDGTIKEFSLSGSIFLNCKKLTEVWLPDNTTEIGGEAFGNCDSLRELTLPDKVTKIEKTAFSGCHDLTIKVKDKSDTAAFLQKKYPDGEIKENGVKNVKIEYVGGKASETGSMIGGGSGMMVIILSIAVVVAGFAGFVVFRRKNQKQA